MTYKAKDSLISRLHEIVILLNGEHRGGKRATFASDFGTARYAIALLAAIMIEIFSDHTISVGNEIFCNFYRLEKVANRLHLQFDRTRIAEKIFEQLEKKGEVKKLVKDNKTFITLTKKGKENCLKKLDQLCELNRLFLYESSYAI
jgi:predicted transcriptional regulator